MCRLVSKQYRVSEWNEFQIGKVIYSSKTPLETADALIAMYDPCEELLIFNGPKIWFTLEPSWHSHFRKDPIGKKLKKILRADEHIFYNTPDPTYRIPHPAFQSPITMPRELKSLDKAVACVTNFGGRFWFCKPHIWLRNRMILNSKVELYGDPTSWEAFRNIPKIWKKGPPENFKNLKAPGSHIYDDNFCRFLSTFKVAVCLENSNETNYFTEKFVNAARAGCIPIYHAHESVKQSFLKGAKWVDPAQFQFSAKRCIEHALAQDQNEFRETNDVWLKSEALKEADDRNIMPRLHKIMEMKIKKIVAT